MASASLATASVVALLVVMGDTGRASPAPKTGSLHHAFPDTRAHNTNTHAKPYARHAHLLGGMVDSLDSAVFDDIVEFLFSQFGEELPQARTYENRLYDTMDYRPGTAYDYSGYDKDKTCIEIYGKAHSSSLCLDVYAALSVAGIALLLQFLFFVSVSTFCPNIIDDHNRSAAPNITNIITIDTSNAVTVETQGGDQTQDQEQGQVQDQDQMQEQMQDGMQGQGQTSTNDQEQDTTVDQVQRQNQEAINEQQQGRKKRSIRKLLYAFFVNRDIKHSRYLSWDTGISLPALSALSLSNLSICPVLGRYLRG